MLANYSAHLLTPQTCPFQWCAHLWGCLWGNRGLLPLPDDLPGVGAGVVAGGPYTVPKGCWIPIPGCPTGRGQGLCLRAYNLLTHIQRLLVWQPVP